MQIKILRIFETLTINRRVILLMMYYKHIDILNVLDLPCLCTCMYMCVIIFITYSLPKPYMCLIFLKFGVSLCLYCIELISCIHINSHSKLHGVNNFCLYLV